MRSRSLITTGAVLAFLSGVALSQVRPEFEVASIRQSNPQGQQFAAGIRSDGAQVRFTLVPLISYIGYAYEVRNYQIVAPDWVRSAFFDVNAKLPDEAALKRLPEMLRSLLTDRFGLKVHREMKEFPVYVLEVAKDGLKMKELPFDPDLQIDEKIPLNVSVVGDRTGTTFSFPGGSFFAAGIDGVEGKKLSMGTLAYGLTPFLDRPTVDRTGLKGVYDFKLKISPEDLRAMGIRSAINAGAPLPPQALQALDNAPGDSLVVSLRNLGLTLVSRKEPLEVIVVDAMQKEPSEN